MPKADRYAKLAENNQYAPLAENDEVNNKITGVEDESTGVYSNNEITGVKSEITVVAGENNGAYDMALIE